VYPFWKFAGIFSCFFTIGGVEEDRKTRQRDLFDMGLEKKGQP
jgi:hypothetical protein